MKTIGLTGGIGMGKSTVAELLQSHGIPVVDSDELARQVVKPGMPALAEIVASFGAGLLDETGHLRRSALAELVFRDPEARRRLETITHPRIATLWRQQLDDWRRKDCRAAVVVIPLLYETNAEREFDEVICVACSEASQTQRLEARHWSAEQIQLRRAAQLPVAEKMSRSGFVIWTEGDLQSTADQVDLFFAKARLE